MAIALSGAGGLFTRLGKVLGTVLNVNGHRSTVAPVPASLWGASGTAINAIQTNIDGLEAQYQSALQNLMDGLYGNLASYRSTQSQFLRSLQDLATQTVIEMAHADTPLSQKTITNALKLLISQMVTAVASVNANTVTASSATGASNNGDGVAAVTVKGPDGKNLENVFAETIELLCTSDSQGGGTLDVEPFSVAGDLAVTDPLDYTWPKGSGATGSLSALDASTTNLLTNGDFELFTVANTPDSWTIGVGAATTDIFSEVAYKGSEALAFTGTGAGPSTLIYQPLTTLLPNTVYAGSVWLKKSAGALAGVLQFDLYNGASVIQNDQAVDNLKSVSVPGLTTSYVNTTFFFITPKVMPTTVRFRIGLTTPLTDSESVFIDHLCFAAATQLYTGGPFAAVFSGATKFLLNDKFTLTVANDHISFQSGFERLFGMRALGLQLPSNASAGETLADSLIL